MKYTLLAIIAFVIGYGVAPRNIPASITLTTPYSISGPNVTPETDTISAPMGICADQITNTLSMTIYPATAQTLNTGKVVSIIPGSIPPITFTVNTATGAWSTTNGQAGKLTGVSLTGAQSWLTSALTNTMKNQAESWLITAGVLPGVQTQWQ